MKTKYRYARTCVYNIKYRIIWCTKGKRKVLSDEIANALRLIIKDTEEKQMFRVESCEVIDRSIVVCTVSSVPKASPSGIASVLKSVSGRKLTLMYPKIRDKKLKEKLWNGSYYLETIGTANELEKEKYISKERNV